MFVSDFHEDFDRYVQDQDLDKANDRLLAELATILVEQKDDFVNMLEESGIEADETMPKKQLIELFTENTDNKKMLLGASLLANSYNKKLSFDGGEEISDDGVKLGYAVLNENFNGDEFEEVGDEEYSYIVPLLAGLIKGGVNLLRNSRQEKTKTRSKQGRNSDLNSEIRRRKADAQRKMQEMAAQRQQVLLQQQQIAAQAAERKRKTKRTYIIIGAVAVTAIIATVIILKSRK
jgi:hypothetical protein